MLKELLVALNEQRNPNLRREIADAMLTDPGVLTPGQIQSLADLRRLWSAIVPMMRILCLSEVNDVTPMWERYADQYRGAVLQFEAVDDLDSVFLMARPVIYQDRLPAIADKQVWARCLARGGGQKALFDLFTEYQHVKTTAWAYEREWRLVSLARPAELDELFSDWGFHHRELTGVYFGSRCTEQDEREILSLLTVGFEHVAAYRAGIRGVAAKFTFEPILTHSTKRADG